jgi:hypothetical protein
LRVWIKARLAPVRPMVAASLAALVPADGATLIGMVDYWP